MKRFLSAFLAVLIAFETFLFFGGYALFDFSGHFYLTGAVWSLIIAAVIHVFVLQQEKINALEKRIGALEARQESAVSSGEGSR